MQNPINLVDPTGMSAEGTDPPTSNKKLTGSSNLLVWINEDPNGKDIHGNPNKKFDVSAAKSASGEYDFIAVDNIDQVQGVLEGHYGKGKVPEINNLVIRSHGAHSKDNRNAHGPDLNMKANAGVIHKPKDSIGLIYLESILSNSANLVFTACNAVQDYGTGQGLSSSSRSVAGYYSGFFLDGTSRSMYMNWSKSYSRDNTSETTEMFNFDSNMRKDSYGGYIRFYYNSAGTWSKDINFYNLTIKSGSGWFSSGGIETSIFKPIK